MSGPLELVRLSWNRCNETYIFIFLPSVGKGPDGFMGPTGLDQLSSFGNLLLDRICKVGPDNGLTYLILDQTILLSVGKGLGLICFMDRHHLFY